MFSVLLEKQKLNPDYHEQQALALLLVRMLVLQRTRMVSCLHIASKPSYLTRVANLTNVGLVLLPCVTCCFLSLLSQFEIWYMFRDCVGTMKAICRDTCKT